MEVLPQSRSNTNQEHIDLITLQCQVINNPYEAFLQDKKVRNVMIIRVSHFFNFIESKYLTFHFSGHNLGQPLLVRNENLFPRTRNICFLNSSLQILSVSGLGEYFKTVFPEHLVGDSSEDYQTARALTRLLKEQSQNAVKQSAAELRRYLLVALIL